MLVVSYASCNYRNIKKKAKGISDMKNAEAVASNFFFLTLGVSGRSSRMPLRNAPSVTSRNGRIILRVWLAHQVQTLMR